MTTNISIKVTIVSRETPRTFNKKDGSTGELVGFVVIDSAGQPVRCTGFGGFVPQWAPALKPGSSFWFTGFKTRNANPRFNTTGFRYELSFDDNSRVQEAAPDPSASKMLRLKLAEGGLSSFADAPAKATGDLLLIIHDAGTPNDFVSKAGRPLTKREVQVCDSSNLVTPLTLWNEEARDFAGRKGDVVALRGAVRDEFNGSVRISMPRGSPAELNPVFESDDPAAQKAAELRAWYQKSGGSGLRAAVGAGGADAGSRGSAGRAALASIVSQRIGMDEGGERVYLTSSVYLENPALNFKPFYPGCPECRRRVQEGGFCAKCNAQVEPKNIWVLRYSCLDHSGSASIALFGDVATQLVGKDGDEVAQLWAAQGEALGGAGAGEDVPAEVEEMFAGLRFKRVVMRLGVSSRHSPNDESQVLQNIGALRIYDFDPVREADAVVFDIEKLMAA